MRPSYHSYPSIHTLLPLCLQASFPVRCGLELGKGGATVYTMVRGYSEVGEGLWDPSVGQHVSVENERSEGKKDTQSAQVDKGTGA